MQAFVGVSCFSKTGFSIYAFAAPTKDSFRHLKILFSHVREMSEFEVNKVCAVSLFVSSLIDRMLQRDPKRRASLEEIETHAWLQGVDPSPATKYNTPLVSHKNLSEEEHNSIIQRMVLGDIADREAIVE